MRIIKNLMVLMILAVTIISCEKDDEVTYEADRPTIVRLKDAELEITAIARDVLPAIDEFVLMDLRRDATRPSDMSQSLTVKVEKDQSLVTAYNTAHGTNYIELPAASYTLSPDISTVTFAPGEDVKTVRIRVDKSSLSLSNQYALGFKITSVGPGAEISTAYRSAVYSIGIKNKYDGVYSVESGVVTRYSAPGVPSGDAFSGSVAGNPDVKLITSGPNSVNFPIATAGVAGGALGWAGGAVAVAGIDGLRITVDPVTNLVTMSSAGNATLGNWAGHVNKYDPATQTFYLAFAWNPLTTPREYEVVLKYKGPR